VVDGGEPGVDSRDERKHTGRNDLSQLNRLHGTKMGKTKKEKRIRSGVSVNSPEKRCSQS